MRRPPSAGFYTIPQKIGAQAKTLMCDTFVQLVTGGLIHMNTSNAKIAAASRQKMAGALLRLMRQYTYQEITITQITQEAQLSRQTFYRLFQDKDEILELFFAGLQREYAACLKAQEIRHYWDAVQLFFDFWEERRALLFLLQKNGLLRRVFERSCRYAPQMFELVRSKEAADANARLLPYLLAYSLGGMHGMLLKWVEEGMKVPSSELITALKEGFRAEGL